MVSLISGQGYFTFLYGRTKHNIHNQEGGRKENKQTRTWVSSKLKKGEVCDTFLAFGELSQGCIRAKIPPSHLERWLILSYWPTRPLGPHIRAVTCSVLLTVLFCPLFCSASFSWLPPSFPSLGPCLPSTFCGLVGNLPHKPFAWVSRQNKQRDPLTWTRIHTHTTNAQHCATYISRCP